MLKLDAQSAAAADQFSATISESGKYVGVITRAEKLGAKTGASGLGISFKTDSGQTADYLDLYHTDKNGKPTFSASTVNAILCCTRVKEVQDGQIECEKWDPSSRSRKKVKANGYPGLMGKRIGFMLRKVLETNSNGKDQTKMEIFGVFEADTELTSSEILGRKTEPEKINVMLDALMAKPVIDKRKPTQAPRGSYGGDFNEFDDIPAGKPSPKPSNGFDDMDDDIPF